MLLLVALATMPVSAATADGSGSAITASRFSITIDGVEIASFSELVGITTEVKEIEFVESGDEVSKTLQVTLRRALTRNTEMSAWHEMVILGDVAAARKDAMLTALSDSGAPVLRYKLTGAWPSKIEIGSLKDKSGATVLMETVTLTCEFIQRVSI